MHGTALFKNARRLGVTWDSMNAKTSKDNGRCAAETDTNATSTFRQLLCKAEVGGGLFRTSSIKRKPDEFQFPSNGKADGKAKGAEVARTAVLPFQFPSNGKADGKEEEGEKRNDKGLQFQFPSNGKADGKFLWGLSLILSLEICFNSLQTGKRMARIEELRDYVHESRFNSLQTGKRMASMRQLR